MEDFQSFVSQLVFKHFVEVESPINIAITKYWGKLDNRTNVALNDSISMTIHMKCLKTNTKIYLHNSPSIKDNLLILNRDIKHAMVLENIPRIQNMFDCLQYFVQYQCQQKKQIINHLLFDLFYIEKKYRMLIISENINLPTKAGLASSASGYSAIAKALCALFLCQSLSNANDMKIIESIVARHGSGSASRSIGDGFVRWFNPYSITNKLQTQNALISNVENMHKSYAHSIFDDQHWKELRILIIIISSKEKTVGSSLGMQNTMETNKLLLFQRLKNVQKRNLNLENAIKNKDFDTFAEICMKESNELHAICLSTFPPLFYMNESSKLIIELCHEMNDCYSNGNEKYMVCYTFDAGANAVLIFRNNICLHIMICVLLRKLKTVEHKEWMFDPLKLIQRGLLNSIKNMGNYICIPQQISMELKNYESFLDMIDIQRIIVARIGTGTQILNVIISKL